MKFISKKIILIALSCLVVVAAVMINDFKLTSIHVTKNDIAPDIEDAFDTYMYNMKVTAFTTEGSPRWQATADRWLHFPAISTTAMQKPSFTMFDKGNENWKVQALNGAINHQGKITNIGEVNLSENASIIFKPKNQQQVTAVSDTLVFVPKKRTITTADAVTISNNSGNIKGKGMIIDLAEKTLNLKSEVTTTYDTANL